MEELIKKTEDILTTFLKEELGNRLSQFSMKGLRDILIFEIKNYKPTEEKVKENAKK